jgi:Tfp pilus assembly protein PilN
VRTPLNLASRPFRNERLPALLFTLALVVLAALTVRHALLVVQLLPGRTAARHTEIAGLEKEAVELRAASQSLRRPDPDKTTLARWGAVKGLVDRRTFAWTSLLARLEAALPHGVRLLSIQPAWDKTGVVRLDLRANAEDADDGFAFVKALEERPDFEDVFPTSKEPRDEGTDFVYTMRYLPQNAPDPVPAQGSGDDDASQDDAGDDEES